MAYLHFVLLSILLTLFANTTLGDIKGYPWSAGISTSSAESDGEKVSLSFQQGVEWGVSSKGELKHWRVSPFVGIDYNRSNIPEHSWNNATRPKYGVELSRQFRYGPINWGEFRAGVQQQTYHYRDGERDYRETERKEAYVRMYMNGNWSN